MANLDVVRDARDIEAFLARVSGAPCLALDTETSGLFGEADVVTGVRR